ncbi:MAG: hypothetical protein JWQ93_913 [Marmoricola sp.]|nr:hypothetical protein [Marmoricola sp.]
MPFLAGSRLLGALVVLCLMLAGVTAYAWYRSNDPAQGRVPDGVIASTQARDTGMRAATSLTRKVLSYDWRTLDEDIKDAEAVLAPSFRRGYSRSMTDVRAKTIENRMRLTASVVASSIVTATERRVEALLFVDRVTTAKGTGPRLDRTRVLVTLTRHGGEWRVSTMDAF